MPANASTRPIAASPVSNVIWNVWSAIDFALMSSIVTNEENGCFGSIVRTASRIRLIVSAPVLLERTTQLTGKYVWLARIHFIFACVTGTYMIATGGPVRS